MQPNRLLLLLITLFIMAPVTFATGTPEPESDSAAPAQEVTPGNSDTFPVTIEHKYGTITLESQPQRVVSVGYSEQDALLALGVVPVGLRDWYGDQPFAVWPWAQDELGDGTPEIIGTTAGLDIEAILALEPDLITGISSGMTAEEYATLSRIAPTLAQSADFIDYGTPWDVELRSIATALGKDGEAESIISGIEAQFEEARRENPAFDGASAASAFLFQELPGAFASQDIRSRFLEQLGFEIPEVYDELAGESFFVSFSEERIDLLDVDMIIWTTSDEAGRQAVRDLPTRRLLNASTEGREVLLDAILSGALSFSSPLSLEYALERIVPGLAAAIDGDPETLVPEDLR